MPLHRLLIIEDDRNIGNLIGHAAEEMDFEVRATCDFCEIPFLHDDFKPHVIVLDILMPDMDGFEVLNYLHKRGSASRVIVISGQPDYLPLAAAMGTGLELAITATLQKPFRIAQFRQALMQVVQSLPSPDGSPSEAAA